MRTNYLPHLAARVFGVPLLIEPQKLYVILKAIGPRLGIVDPSFMLAAIPQVTLQVPVDDEEEIDDLTSRKPYEVTLDGIAVIGIEGTLVKKASWLDAVSGMQGYDSIRAKLADAANDPRIRGILLDVNSPGGEVGGLYDLADTIYAVRDVKPCFSIANDEAFSAAYAIASSAQRVFVTRTGGVGSIGVIAIHVDQSGFDEKVGRKYTAVYAGAKKNDFTPHQPLSDAAKETLQSEIDRLYEIFVSTVARNRMMPAAGVRKTEAGLYFGENAVSEGLADEVGTVDDALDALRSAIASKAGRVAASAATQIPTVEDTNMEQETTQTQADATSQQTVDVAAVEAAAEARLRAQIEEISALCAVAGHPEFLTEAIAKKMTAAQVREALTAMQAKKSQETAVNGQLTQATPVGAEAQLTAAAQQIAVTKGIPFAQAYVQALNQNPKLYQQYLAERSAATVKPN